MFYEAVAEDDTRSIGLAVSQDGKTGWQRLDRCPLNPVFKVLHLILCFKIPVNILKGMETYGRGLLGQQSLEGLWLLGHSNSPIPRVIARTL